MKLTKDQKEQYLDILERLKNAQNNEDWADEEYIELAVLKTNLVQMELDLFLRTVKMENKI